MTTSEVTSQAQVASNPRVVHRRYVGHGDAHYGGGIVSGAFIVTLFNDIATDLCIQSDNDEGLFASYSNITFHRPVIAGDVLEVAAELLEVGRRSRRVGFTAHVIARSNVDAGPSAATVLSERLLVTSAEGTVVVPTPRSSRESSGGTS